MLTVDSSHVARIRYTGRKKDEKTKRSVAPITDGEQVVDSGFVHPAFFLVILHLRLRSQLETLFLDREYRRAGSFFLVRAMRMN